MALRGVAAAGWLVVLALMVPAACSDDAEPVTTDAAPRAWIDHPRDGARIPVGAEVVVVSHANAEDGVTEVLLSVDGTPLSRDAPTATGDSLVEVRQPWVPQEPGRHTLEVRAYTAAGEAPGADAITVEVIGEPMETTTSTFPPGTTTPGTTSTSTSTSPPVVSTTSSTVPPSLRPPEITFSADVTRLAAGGCTTLRWEVRFADTVTLDGASVSPTGTREVCPTATEAYELQADGPGGATARTVTITVTAAPDTTPPPVPTLAVPADRLALSCRLTQTLAWLPVTDPSGVTYDVTLERQQTATEWVPVDEWTDLTDKQVQAEVECGGIYRWSVRARDGAGNESAWATPFTFTVDLS